MRVVGYVGSNICDVLKLHHKRPSFTGRIRQAAKDRKKLREGLQPFWVEKADDDTRQPRGEIGVCPCQGPWIQQAGGLGALAPADAPNMEDRCKGLLFDADGDKGHMRLRQHDLRGVMGGKDHIQWQRRYSCRRRGQSR